MAEFVQVSVGKIKSLFTSQPGVCVQCHQTLGAGRPSKSVSKEGVNLEFCSQHCAHNYWRDYKRHCERTPGRSVCSFPGCHKPCYQEGFKTHDYCGRTHAREHKAMIEAMKREHRGQHYGGGGSGRNSRQNGAIKFYNRGEPYYEFTNFFEVVVKIDGKEWPTTEHYFQAQKFVGTQIPEEIRLLSRPREAFDMSRDPRYSRWRRSDWEEVKERVMYKALQAKFSQHKHLRQLLLETGERPLIEHSPYDSYWGDGGDGTGRNRLGYLLMELRNEMNPKKKETHLLSSPHSVTEQCGALDKQPIYVGGTSVDSNSKPADQSPSSQAQDGNSGGAGSQGQPSRPECDHTHQPMNDHLARKFPGENTGDSLHTCDMAITQPPAATTQSFLVTFTPAAHANPNNPSTNISTSAAHPNPFVKLFPSQSQALHTQTSGTSSSHGSQNQQLQSGLTQDQVMQESSAMGPSTYTTQSSSPAVTYSSTTAMTATSEQSLRSQIGTTTEPAVGSNPALVVQASTPGSHFAENQQQRQVSQASGAMQPTPTTPWNTGQPSSFSTAMSQLPHQYCCASGPVAPPPGFNPSSGGTHSSTTTSANQLNAQTSNGPFPSPIPIGTHPDYSSVVSSQPTWGGSLSTQNSKMHAQQQATLHPSQRNPPGTNSPEEPMDTSELGNLYNT